MKNKWLKLGLAVVPLLFALLSACSSGTQTETIIIPGIEEGNQMDQGSSPFQVHKIYRLPEKFTRMGEVLGWSSSGSVLISSKTDSIPEHLVVKRLTDPFEKSEDLTEINSSDARLVLSPDGSRLCEIFTSGSDISIKVYSLKDGKETEVAKLSTKYPMYLYLQNLSWSDNSRYLSYLMLDPAGSGKDTLYLYDIESGTSKTYELKDIAKESSLLSAKVSDDGSGVLLSLYPSSGRSQISIVLGKMTDNRIEMKYTRQIGSEQYTWMNKDQFVFLGTDGTLYEYDRRNGELSVILERISGFEFSYDKKFIAYSLRDEDTIYVGKIQGRNVLYNEPVYRGVVPGNMYWGQNNTYLLIQRQEAFSHSQVLQNYTTTGPSSFIIEFK